MPPRPQHAILCSVFGTPGENLKLPSENEISLKKIEAFGLSQTKTEKTPYLIHNELAIPSAGQSGGETPG
jgi:hypothetical protein